MTQHQQLNILRRLTTATDHDESKQIRKAAYKTLNNTTTIMPEPCEHGRAEVFEPHRPWRLCSGMAHAKMWPGLGFHEREVIPSGGPGISRLRTTTDHRRVLWAAQSTFELTNDAMNRYDQLSRSTVKGGRGPGRDEQRLSSTNVSALAAVS